MAQAMASMTGASQQVGLGSLSSRRISAGRAGFIVRAQQSPVESETVVQTGRRAALGLIAAGVTGGAFAQVALAAARSIKIGPPPLPSGGLPGTENSDQARDFDLPLKNRFYIQPLSPSEAMVRVKESAKDIFNLKSQIDKKAWPYVQNDLRLKASYLRYDLNTIISAKPKEEKKPLKEIYGKLFATIDELDHAAKIKSPKEAEKYFAETTSVLNDVIAKLG
ncbi:oxygen-evolving enhancer protein 3-1, chloroplastic-like [Carex rostrata]